MKKFFLLSALSATLVLPVIASAAWYPTKEPQTVFVRGANPEWAAHHAESQSKEHRSYHKQATSDLAAWKAAHKNTLSGADYSKELRNYLTQMNRDHRTFHGWEAKAPSKALLLPKAGTVSSPWVNISAQESLRSNGFTPENWSRAYTGNRPSSRLMRDSARTRGHMGK